jgi:hypothetical protein
LRAIDIQFPDGQRHTREWLEEHAEEAQALMAACQGRYPICQCRNPGAALYVSQRSRYCLARLPNTGPEHASFCPSYEPEPSLCGRGIYSTRALEDRGDGKLHVKLGVPLLIRGAGNAASVMSPPHGSVERAARDTLELRGLLHLLWERAEFNRWLPAMRGRRRYRQLFKYLIEAAETITVRRQPLTRHLYMPEPFVLEQALEIEARRQRLMRELSQTASGLPLRILVLGRLRAVVESAEVSGIRLANWPNELVLRADATTLARLHQASEFAWIDFPALNPEFRLMMLLTVQRTKHGHWKIEEIAPMVCTEDYIPVLSMEEALVAKRLAAEGRAFLKPLPYDAAQMRYPNFLLTDCGTRAVPLEIVSGSDADAAARHQRIAEYVAEERPHWLWDSQESAMPPALLQPAA